MKRTCNILMIIYVGIIVLAGILLILFETDCLESGTAIGNNRAEFLIQTIMELLTLGQIFLALRLFKIKYVRQDLMARKEQALQKWGVLRLVLLGIPLVANVLFYEMFLKTTFGYMAIVLLLCLPFVYPSMARCEAEVTSENKDEHEEINNHNSQL